MPYLMYLLKKAIVSGCAYPPVSNERDDKVPKIMDASQTHGAIGASYRMVSGGS